MSGVATSFQAQAIHFRFAPDYRRIAVSQQMTFGAKNCVVHCSKFGEVLNCLVRREAHQAESLASFRSSVWKPSVNQP